MFRLRQFSITQDNATWKVGTDSLLLGAWVACDDRIVRVLDIGAGTGILSLMVAQRSRAPRITAVEIDAATVKDLRVNCAASPWSERFEVLPGNICRLVVSWNESFDLVICNPPYFHGGPQSAGQKRALARGGAEFHLMSLAQLSAPLLTDQGTLAVVLPAQSTDRFITLANADGLYVCRRMDICHTKDKPPSLALLQLQKRLGPVTTDRLVLYTSHKRTHAFSALCSDFFNEELSWTSPESRKDQK